MSEGIEAIGLTISAFLLVSIFFVSLIGGRHFYKKAMPIWKGFVLGGFTGGVVGLFLIAVLSFIFFNF